MTDFHELREQFFQGKVAEAAEECRKAIAANGYDTRAAALLLRVETACGNAENVARLGSQLMAQEASEVTALLTSFGFDTAGDAATARKFLETGGALPNQIGKISHELSRWELLDEVANLASGPLDSRAPQDRDGIDIITVLFDEKMSTLARDLMIPSLYANCSELLERYKVRHYFFTSTKDLAILEPAFEALRKDGRDIIVDTATIDDILGRPEHPSKLLHGPYRRVLQSAYEQGHPVVIAPPDHFFGFGIERQLARLPRGGLLVAGHPRVDWHTAPALLQDWLATNDGQENATLVKLALCDAPHLMVNYGFEKDNPYWRGTLSENQATVYFKEPPPLLIDPVPDLIGLMDERAYIGPYQALDHDMVEYTYRTDRLAWVDNSDDFFWCELTSPDQYNPTFINLYLTRSSRHFQKLPLTFKF